MAANWKETKPYRQFVFWAWHTAIIVIAVVARNILITEGILSPGLPSFLGLIGLIIGLWVLIFVVFGSAVAGVQQFIDSSFFGRGGNARFAGLFEEIQERYATGGIYFGRSLFSRFLWIGPKDDRHMLTIGGSRSGKGVCCIIPNLLLWRGSTLVIDPKGTNTYVTAQERCRKGNTVHIVDPFHVIPPDTGHFYIEKFGDFAGLIPPGMNLHARFNPLEHLDPDSRTIVEDIGVIADALIVHEGDAKDKHFTNSARSMVAGYIAHVVSSPDFADPSLLDIYKIVSRTPEELADIHGAMMANEECGGLPAQTARRILTGSGTNELQSVYATAVEQLKWLTSKAMIQTLSKASDQPAPDPYAPDHGGTVGESFRVSDMKDSPTSIYLILPPEYIDEHKRFLRLFVNLAVNEYPRGGRARVPGLFLIDEAHSLGYMEKIARGYGLLASYNLVLWTFFQDRGQLTELYKGEAQTFIGSSRATQIFGVRGEDAEWVAQMIGTRALPDTGKHVRSTTAIMGLRDPASVTAEVGGQLGRQYILRGGRPPMILDMMPYFKSGYLKCFAGIDPDYADETKAESTDWLMTVVNATQATIGRLVPNRNIIPLFVLPLARSLQIGVFLLVLYLVASGLGWITDRGDGRPEVANAPAAQSQTSQAPSQTHQTGTDTASLIIAELTELEEIASSLGSNVSKGSLEALRLQMPEEHSRYISFLLLLERSRQTLQGNDRALIERLRSYNIDGGIEQIWPLSDAVPGAAQSRQNSEGPPLLRPAYAHQHGVIEKIHRMVDDLRADGLEPDQFSMDVLYDMVLTEEDRQIVDDARVELKQFRDSGESNLDRLSDLARLLKYHSDRLEFAFLDNETGMQTAF